MNNDVRHSQTPGDTLKHNEGLVTLNVVSSLFISAGLPRSMRTLQRYCANGTLECVKEATETGDTYFVLERSIDTAIEALRQLHDAKDKPRNAATRRAMTPPVTAQESLQNDVDTDGHRPTVSDEDAEQGSERHGPSGADTSGTVAQLTERLAEKDEEIAFLREELIDRRGQIKDMKGIIDGQNQLLEAIQTNVAPIFKALAATVETKRIKVSPGKIFERSNGDAEDVETETRELDLRVHQDVCPNSETRQGRRFL